MYVWVVLVQVWVCVNLLCDEVVEVFGGGCKQESEAVDDRVCACAVRDGRGGGRLPQNYCEAEDKFIIV
jgi:hypothetical protein